MPIEWDSSQWEGISANFEHFFEGFREDLKLAGENAAESIVRFTLAGIGANDSPFATYSQSYQKLIDSVGGKPRGVVDLRGMFYHEGQKHVKFKSEERRRRFRADRRAWLDVRFFRSDDTPVHFRAKTQITRPAKGVIDPLSEMSLDLIRIETTDTLLKIIYNPRKNNYMIGHNNGTNRGPKREWFTIERRGIIAGIVNVVSTALKARAQRFNNGEPVK